MLLMIDNYDSFTYNLVQYFGELGEVVEVVRNDEIEVSDIAALRPDRIVISPGPCTPDEAGISIEVVRRYHGLVPILGVCLGHQAIARAFGGRIVRARELVHGKARRVHHDGESLFRGLPSPIVAGRYHSLVVDPASLPPELTVSAWSDDDTIMGIRHRKGFLEGIQFHPESILTPCGKEIVRNFLCSVPREDTVG